MLRVAVQELGDAAVLCCRGRIVTGPACSTLRDTARGQGHARLLVLDLAEVEQIDAGGLGVLLGLREWARVNAIRFKLLNVSNRVEQMLQLTALNRVFEICSVPESLCLLHRGAASDWRPFEQSDVSHANFSRQRMG